MKKLFTLLLTALLLLSLTACAQSKDLKEEGIAPYALSEEEEFLMYSFGMNSGNTQILSFNAPKEAITLNVHIYRLSPDGNWEEVDGGGISIGEERAPVDTLTGVFAMELRENYSMDFDINCGGLASYKTTKVVDLEREILSSTSAFLQEHQEIQLNTEIPVALMVYTGGSSMQSYSLQDFFEPAKFEGMDLVQAVTLEFSDKEIA